MNEKIDSQSQQPHGQPVIYRCCITCRQKKDRKTMIRVVHNRMTQQVDIIMPGTEKTVTSGRSSYICFAPACIEKAIKAKKLQKTLKTSLADDIVNCLLQLP